MKTEQILLLFILILLAACTAFAWGFAHYRKRWFSLYQNVQNFQKTLLEDGQIPAASPGEDAENIIRDGFVRIEKKYGREREAALRDKDAIQSLILDLSHQLKTPLANIQLYQELLRAPDLPPDKKKQLEDRLEEQTDKLDWLLGSLFKMADLERGTAALNASYTSVIPTVRKAVESILLKADQKKIRIEMSPFSDAPLFHDSAWTEEVFVNLLENAVKYARKKQPSICPWSAMRRMALSASAMRARASRRKSTAAFFRNSTEAAPLLARRDGASVSTFPGSFLKRSGAISLWTHPWEKGAALPCFCRL